MLKKLSYFIVLLVSFTSLANEKKLEKESTVFNKTFSWQAQLGFSLQYVDDILKDVEQSDTGRYGNISLLFDFYYKGFFIQTNHRRAITNTLGAEIGYQLSLEDDWEIDILKKTYIMGFSPKEILENADRDIPILDGLKRRSIGEGLAVRYSRYFDDGYFSIDVAHLAPFSRPTGWVVDAFYSHLVPYRNWDIYLNGGLTLYSDRVVNYYVGIDNEETSSLRPYYKAKAGAKAQLEIFVQHPISESWTFNAGVSQSFYTSNVTDSPIIDSNGETHAMLGVLYVF